MSQQINILRLFKVLLKVVNRVVWERGQFKVGRAGR